MPTKPCFPDDAPLVADGAAEVKDGFYIVQIANLSCMQPFGNPFLDGVAGFPGPLFYEARFRVTPRQEQP